MKRNSKKVCYMLSVILILLIGIAITIYMNKSYTDLWRNKIKM